MALTLKDSPIQTIEFEGINFLVKRDDLLDENFSGNKARKLAYYLEHALPKIKKIVSYGSVQSNFLYSISALATIKNWQLDFYVQRIPPWLKKTPLGNYKAAIELGANIIEFAHDSYESFEKAIKEQFSKVNNSTLLIEEGGRTKDAEYGIINLAKEIEVYCSQGNLKSPTIMLPSGTGTTSLFLAKYLNNLKSNYKVLTCACVGDAQYLRKQFSQLSKCEGDWPTILPTKKNYHFGKTYPEHYEIWQDLRKQTGIEFDLLYDPIGWRVLLDYVRTKPKEEDIIYIHQGGLKGNESMVARYIRTNNRLFL